MVVLSAFMMLMMFMLLALAVDLGQIVVSGSELQRTADAAAIAATWDLIDEDAVRGYDDSATLPDEARATASQYASVNRVLRESPGLAQEDVTVGYLANPSDPACPLIVGGPDAPNAVRVRVRRTEAQNGLVPLFFARLLGIDGAANQAEATAAVLTNFGGFGPPGGHGNLPILPFALDQDTWSGRNTNDNDDWTWNRETGEVTSGGDGIHEVNLFPQGIDSPGNRGTVDIGAPNNSTADIARQILYGITPEDLAYVGGCLKLDAGGELLLNGDTGISAGVKDELESIKGQRRIIPIFSQVSGNGNNAQYTIVDFACVRVMEVKLTGNMDSKRVMVQPANIVIRGGIPSSGPKTSWFIYSPVWLVR
jgi:hypothetical protein